MTLLFYVLIFFVLILLGCPIHICMGMSAVLWLIFTDSVPGFIFASKSYAQYDSFSLMAIPFFMLAGQIMETTGITQNIIKFCNSLVGHVRGGLAHTATLTGIIMAGVSGSANADGAAIGSVMLPALKESGYEDGQAVAIIASAGCLGPIIPPSIFMIILCNATGSNIGKLFMAGIIPGLLMGIGFMVVNYIYAKRHNVPVTKFQGFKYVFTTFLEAFFAMLMPIIIIGGILGGVFTATESGCAAVVYGIIYGLAKGKLSVKKLIHCFTEAVISSVGPMLLIACSGVFAYMLTSMGTDKIVANFVLTYIPDKHLFLLFILLLGLFLGCFIDSIASCLMLMPILTPIVNALGIDFLHFSIVFTTAFLSCTITPPVGTLLYVICGIDNTPIVKTIKPILPYVLIMVIVIIAMIFIPEIGTWIPSMM